MKKYRALVVEDHREVRNLLVECLRLSDFDAEGYGRAEDLLRDVFSAGLGPEQLPDLVVVDLQLEPSKMQGMELLSELAERNIPSEIVVISGHLTGEEREEAIKIGAADGFPKPFRVFELMPRMEHFAEKGRKRRLFRLQAKGGAPALDPSRLHRPVFLSYSDADRRLAAGLRRNIEAIDIPVWYAPTTLEVGDTWRYRIEQGIDLATIFIPLITDHYLESPICVAELVRFYRRTTLATTPKPEVLPLLAGLSEKGKQHDILLQILDRFHCLDISKCFTDGLTALLMTVERVLAEKQLAPRRGEVQSPISVHHPEKIA